MTIRHCILSVLGLLAVAGSLAVLARRFHSGPSVEAKATESPSTSGVFAPTPAPAAPTAAAAGVVPSNKSFRALPVLERSVILAEIRRRPLAEIFSLWQQAGAVDRDLMKQGAIATMLAHTLRETPPSQELLDEMWRYVVDGNNPLRERGWVLGIFGGSKTVTGIEFLLKAATNLPESQLRQVAIEQIGGMGDLWGDGSYHEERSPPLEQAWTDAAAGSDLLARVAFALARIGAPSGVQTLILAAVDGDPANSDRRQAAIYALSQVHTRNAVAPIASRLADEEQATPLAVLLSRILVGIGDAAAAESVINWLHAVDAGAIELVPQLVAGSRSPAMLQAWEAQLSSTDARATRIRNAISYSLAERKKGTFAQ